MLTVLLVIHVFITVALVGVILIQRNASDGLSGLGGGGGGNSLISGRTSANLLTRSTAILAALFMLNSLVMGSIVSHQSKRASIADTIVSEQAPAEGTATENAPEEPKTPEVPLAE